MFQANLFSRKQLKELRGKQAMTVRIQNPNYSKAKPYTEITCDFVSDTCDLKIIEGRFAEVDGNYRLYACIEEIDGLKDTSKFKPNDLYYIDFHTKTYETWTMDNPKAPTEPALFEQIVTAWLKEPTEEFNPLETFAGVISINTNKMFLKKIKDGKNSITDIFGVENIEPLGKLQEVTTSGKGGGYGKSTQKERERLEDRYDFLVSTLGLKTEENPKPAFEEVIEKLASVGDGSLLESGHLQIDVLTLLMGK